MNGRYILDTTVVIGLFAKDGTIQQRLSGASEVFLPSIALGELYYGARKSGRIEENVRRIDEFAATITVLECDVETARQYGHIKNDLRVRGRPIPENDIWIAAIAQQHQLVVATRDDHFAEVSGLLVQKW